MVLGNLPSASDRANLLFVLESGGRNPISRDNDPRSGSVNRFVFRCCLDGDVKRCLVYYKLSRKIG